MNYKKVFPVSDAFPDAATDFSHHAAGFTLIEIIIVVAIVAILASLIVPLAVNQATQKRIDVCRDELVVLKQAIVGDATRVEGGTRTSFGFVGDVGLLPTSRPAPAAPLDDLLTNYYVAWQQDAGTGLWHGWRGPYVSEVIDPWGNNYQYTTAGLPANVAARLWSYGYNGANDSGGGNPIGGDDINIDVFEDEWRSRVSGNTFDKDFVQFNFTGQVNPPGYVLAIALYYPNGTAVLQTATLTYAAGATIYQFSTAPYVPIGVRCLRFKQSATAALVTTLLHVNNGPMTTMNLIGPE